MCLLTPWNWIPGCHASAGKRGSLSPPHRITVHTDDIQRWAPRQTVRFDLIISNPPYYEPGVECATPQREQARYTATLDHQTLLAIAADCITEDGFLRSLAGTNR